jgi:hypothetical protein
VAGSPAALLGAAVVTHAGRALDRVRVERGRRRTLDERGGGALLGTAVVAGVAGRALRAHVDCGARDRVTVVVGGEDHDGGGQADDRDHGDCEQRAEQVEAGAEYDRGMLGGDCLAHYYLLGVVGRVGAIVHGPGCGAATRR